MNTVVKEFFKQYPEYDNDNYFVKYVLSERYGGDYEIIVYDINPANPVCEKEYKCTYWCKLWNNEAETTYQFELEQEINTMRIGIDIQDIADELAHYDYDERDYQIIEEHAISKYLYVDYPRIEKNVIEKFKERNDKKIRAELARRILSGELQINYSCVDTDSWETPLNQIEIYKV